MSTDNKSAYDSNIYDEHIVNVLPYYREYHDQIIDLVRICKQDPIDWLDTGCGTGTLASRVLEKEQNVRFTLCDPSEKMLNEAFPIIIYVRSLWFSDISTENSRSASRESPEEYRS